MAFFYATTAKAKRKAKSTIADKKQTVTIGDIQKPAKRRTKSSAPEFLAQAALGCAGCPLNTEKLIHPKLPPSGSEHPLVYVIGEGVSDEDDAAGTHFINEAGRLLRGLIPPQYKERIRFNHIIRCKTVPGNRGALPIELACCARQQIEDIQRTKPKIVLALGHQAMNFAIGRSNINAWHSRFIPTTIGDHACYMYAIHAPEFVLVKKYEPKWRELFKFSVTRFFESIDKLGDPVLVDPSTYYTNIQYLTDPDLSTVQKWFNLIAAEPKCALDIETNGTRPFNKNSKILSISFGTYDATYVVPIAHREAKWTDDQRCQLMSMLKHFLLNSGIKFAHNLMFELEWLSYLLGDELLYETEWGDTQSQAYILDARSGALALNDITRIYLGFDIKSLSTVDVIDLDNEPLIDVMKYNGLDTKWTDLVRWIMDDELESRKLMDVYQFHVQRVAPLVKAQTKGLERNLPVILAHRTRLTKDLVRIEAEIASMPDVEKFVSITGKKFKPSSPKDIATLLRDHLGIKQNGTKFSTDEEALAKINHPIAQKIVELRGTIKMKSTYIDPFLPAGVDPDLPQGGYLVWGDGLIHCSYHHTRTISGRLSSSDPNTQNFPKREAKDIRSVVAAPKGYLIVSCDEGQIEARGIAMASKDRILVKAIREDYDIHMDWTEKLAFAFPSKVGGTKFLHDKKALKKFRSDVKNVWTFPLFYGSVVDSVARNLGVAVKHPTKNKMVAPKKLIDLFDEFWDMFDGVRKWQEALRLQVKRDGYVSGLTGRRRYLPLSDNEAINTPIQGLASDIVVDSMYRLSKIAYIENRPQLHAVMNVHDDLTFYIPDATLEMDVETIGREMVRLPWKWMNVPLVAEVGIGTNWGNVEEKVKFSSEDFGFKYYE